MNDVTKGTVRGALGGAGGILLAIVIASFFSKGSQIWSHVDKDVSISDLQEIDQKLGNEQKNLKNKYEKDHNKIRGCPS